MTRDELDILWLVELAESGLATPDQLARLQHMGDTPALRAARQQARALSQHIARFAAINLPTTDHAFTQQVLQAIAYQPLWNLPSIEIDAAPAIALPPTPEPPADLLCELDLPPAELRIEYLAQLAAYHDTPNIPPIADDDELRAAAERLARDPAARAAYQANLPAARALAAWATGTRAVESQTPLPAPGLVAERVFSLEDQAESALNHALEAYVRHTAGILNDHDLSPVAERVFNQIREEEEQLDNALNLYASDSGEEIERAELTGLTGLVMARLTDQPAQLDSPPQDAPAPIRFAEHAERVFAEPAAERVFAEPTSERVFAEPTSERVFAQASQRLRLRRTLTRVAGSAIALAACLAIAAIYLPRQLFTDPNAPISPLGPATDQTTLAATSDATFQIAFTGPTQAVDLPDDAHIDLAWEPAALADREGPDWNPGDLLPADDASARPTGTVHIALSPSPASDDTAIMMYLTAATLHQQRDWPHAPWIHNALALAWSPPARHGLAPGLPADDRHGPAASHRQ